MTTNREMERIVRSWLEPGLTTLTDDVLDAVMDQLPATPQRRRWSPARRIANMNPLAKYALATAAVVVIAIVGVNLLGTAGSGGVGGVAPSPLPSPASSSGSYRLAPTSGSIVPGRYRWMSANAQVLFTLPDGWTGGAESFIGKNEDTPTEATFGHNLPGSRYEVTHVYTDACFSEGALEPIGDTADDLVQALDAQGSTDVVARDIAAGSVVGKRIEIREAPAVDRSLCRHGAEGPLQIWADAAENSYFSFSPGHWGVAYVFDVGGDRFVFNATYGPEASEADIEEVDAIVETFQFTRH